MHRSVETIEVSSQHKLQASYLEYSFQSAVVDSCRSPYTYRNGYQRFPVTAFIKKKCKVNLLPVTKMLYTYNELFNLCCADPQKAVLVAADEIIQRKLFSLLALGTPLSQDHLKQILYLIRRPTDKPVLHHRKSCSIVSHAIYRIISCIRYILKIYIFFSENLQPVLWSNS